MTFLARKTANLKREKTSGNAPRNGRVPWCIQFVRHLRCLRALSTAEVHALLCKKPLFTVSKNQEAKFFLNNEENTILY